MPEPARQASRRAQRLEKLCDPRFGVTTYEVTNISQAAPDPSLFQIPADYTEEKHH